MKKTNRTYQVYIANAKITGRLGMGTKKEMKDLYEQVKDDPEYECVELCKWSERYNCWYAVEKTIKEI